MVRASVLTLTLCSGIGLAACGAVQPNTCADDSECVAGGVYVCDTADTQQCLRRCATSGATTECLDSEHCVMLAGKAYGVCRYGKATP